jgi:hypothetical protein
VAYVSGFLLQSSVVWHTHRLGVELASQMIVLAPKSFGGWFPILGHHILPRPFRTLIVLGTFLEPEPVVVAAAAECCCFSLGLLDLSCSTCAVSARSVLAPCGRRPLLGCNRALYLTTICHQVVDPNVMTFFVFILLAPDEVLEFGIVCDLVSLNSGWRSLEVSPLAARLLT